jgi:hypothetical protein
MEGLLRLIWDALKAVWPLVVVMSWERGIRMAMGKPVWTVGTSYWPRFHLWGVYELHKVSMIQYPVALTIKHINLLDDTVLSYSAVMQVVVKDPIKAYTTVEDYKHAFVHMASGILSEELRDAEVHRFQKDYGKRGRLLEELRDTLNENCRQFGLEVLSVKMEEFVRGGWTLRILSNPFYNAGSPTFPKEVLP